MQLAPAQAGLTQSNIPNQGRHCLRLSRPAPFAMPSPVVRLTADTHVAAGPCNAQPFDVLLRDGLPEGFFTSTPCSLRMISITASNSDAFSCA